MSDKHRDGDQETVRLLQTGGFAGLEMSASLTLSDLPAAAADHTRELVDQVLAERPAAAAGSAGGSAGAPPMPDALEYELSISRPGLAPNTIVARDGALTPAQQNLIEVLRPHLTPG